MLSLYLRSGRTYSLNSTPYDKFLRTFHVNLIDSQSYCQKCAERRSPKTIFVISFPCRCLTRRRLSRGPTTNKSYYLLDYLMRSYCLYITALLFPKDSVVCNLVSPRIHYIVNSLLNHIAYVLNNLAV